MPTRHAAALVALLLLCSATGHQGPATAQEEPVVEMALVSQSAWNGPNRPLKIKVKVTNRSEVPIEQISLVLVIHAPARARSVYELSLEADATPPIFALPFPQPGALRPGEPRTFSIKQELDDLTALAFADSALYPLKVQLLSGLVPVAEIRSPMIFLIEEPEVPLLFSWTWELAAKLEYGPGGTFLSGDLEADIAPGGRIASLVETLERLGPVPLDLLVSSALLDQLRRMASGYRIRDPEGPLREVPAGTGGADHAAALLQSLREVATRPATEVLALPLGDASLTALLRAGLSRDASELLAMGRELVGEVLGRVPRHDIYRPPASDLDAATITALVEMGTETVVVEAGYLPPAPGLMFNPSPVMRLVAGRTAVSAIRADAGVMAAARRSRDQRLAAQAALGELAAIWLELPGTPGRGAMLVLPGTEPFSPAFLSSFSRLVRASPWLDPVIASRMPSLVPAGGRRSIPADPSPTLPTGYVERLLRTRSSLNQFALTVPKADELVERLRGNLRTALSASFLDDPAQGDRFIDSVEGSIRRTYSQVRIESTPVTLASRSGSIPITVENRSGYPLDVTVRLIADRSLAFPNGRTRRMTLPLEPRTFLFPVRAQTTGRLPVKIQIRTPVDQTIAETIVETQLVVRSTAYNRVALFFTVGAALFLLVWWGRRFLPRRKAQEH